MVKKTENITLDGKQTIRITLEKEFNVPVYVLTQPSNKIPSGADIPIEVRHEDELLKFQGRRIAPKGVKGFYPGFDVIPRNLITQPIEINVN